MDSPSEFQRNVLNILAVLGLSQVHISRDESGKFSLKANSVCKRFLYFLLWGNTFAKFLFLVVLSSGNLQEEFEFFEKMTIVLWFLIMILMATSERFWYRRYPFYEVYFNTKTTTILFKHN